MDKPSTSTRPYEDTPAAGEAWPESPPRRVSPKVVDTVARAGDLAGTLRHLAGRLDAAASELRPTVDEHGGPELEAECLAGELEVLGESLEPFADRLPLFEIKVDSYVYEDPDDCDEDDLDDEGEGEGP